MSDLPLCQCGCGRPVKYRRCRWFSTACVPHEVRAQAGRKAALQSIQRRRELRFFAELQRLTASGHKITREDLLATFASIALRAWGNGYASCEKKYQQKRKVA